MSVQKILLILALVIPMSVPAADRTVNVDFQPGPTGNRFAADFSGTGWLNSSDGQTWNPVGVPVRGYTSSWGSGGLFDFDDVFVSAMLIDAAGRPTPVTVAVHRGEPHGTTFAVCPSNVWAYQHIATDAQNLMSDYLIAPGNGTNLVVVNGLVPAAEYTLVLYGAGDQNTHQTKFAVGGAGKSTSGVPHEPHTMAVGVDYIVLRAAAGDDGTLTVRYSGVGASRDGNFNGLQLRGPLDHSGEETP